ncbi:MAG: hypothetical protein M3P51_04010 [Chloroflexota bacterium]|nr:hypothetical protein [Chloroflexota bacterium]
MKKALLSVAAALVAVVVILFVIWFLINPTLAVLRDLVIVAMGLAFFVLLLSLVGLALGLVALVALVRKKVPNLLDTATSTAESVRGTTGFVGERVASPIIKITSSAAGARAAVQTIVRRDNPQ